MAALAKFARFKQMGRRLAIVSMMTILSAAFAVSQSNASEKFSFLVISDMPYSDGQNETLTETVIPTMRRSGLPFVVLLGDIKGGGEACTNRLLLERRDQVLSMHPDRVFYTPGDNEWTDCDRDGLSVRFSELDRLDLIRRLFYSHPLPLSADWQFTRQALYPENMRWTYGNVVFSTLHIVGTGNGRRQILLDDLDLALTRVDARDRANILWMEDAFERAREQNAAALVFAIQADVTKSRYKDACTFTRRQNCDPFATFKIRLRELSASFERPVLLMHGDTRPYCLDQEFGGSAAPNLWRFDSTGDYSYIDAVKVTFDPQSTTTPFTFISLVQGIEPKVGCSK